MKYFKVIEVENVKKISEDFLSYYKENHQKFNRINSFWNEFDPIHYEQFLNEVESICDLTSQFGEVKEMALLILWRDSSTLHIDHITGLNKDVKARLNIPIMNCKGSYTEFFELSPEKFALGKKNLGGTTSWPHIIRNTEKPVSVVELIQPTILRTSTPHTVKCSNCEFPRISLTISFKDDVVKYLDECN